MSSSSSDEHDAQIAELLREIRQFNGLSAFFFRAAAAQIGMAVTDLQVIDILEHTGPATAGQLAEQTGLTTGAITGMIDRLEKAGMVRRENDPNDGRRVLVRLSPSETAMKEIGPLFDSVGQRWDDLASKYDQGQLALLTDFLRDTNIISKEEITRLRNAPKSAQKDFVATLGNIKSGRLIFLSGASMLKLNADSRLPELYKARFEGTPPDIKINDGTVSIRNRRRLWLLEWGQQDAEITLNATIPWQIEIKGGASEVKADLTNLNLVELNVSYGSSSVEIRLPVPAGTVPLRISGGASEVTIQRPGGIPARVRFTGWASAITFDDQPLSGVRNDLRLQSLGYEDATGRYDIEISGNASMVTINAG